MTHRIVCIYIHNPLSYIVTRKIKHFIQILSVKSGCEYRRQSNKDR